MIVTYRCGCAAVETFSVFCSSVSWPFSSSDLGAGVFGVDVITAELPVNKQVIRQEYNICLILDERDCLSTEIFSPNMLQMDLGWNGEKN